MENNHKKRKDRAKRKKSQTKNATLWEIIRKFNTMMTTKEF